MEKERERLRKKIKDTTPAASPSRKAKKAHKPEEFKLGETVKVLSMNLTGTVQSLPDPRGNITVQMGILRSQVNISDLEIVEEPSPYTPKKLNRTSKGKIGMSKSLSVSPEINLLGKTVDEAVAELDKYLDDALLSHLNTVRVVHGKGTGALRKGIHEYLRRQKHVKDYHLAEDAAQETFIKAMNSYDMFHSLSSEKTWLTRIAINCCKNIMRTNWFRTSRNQLIDDISTQEDFTQSLIERDSVSSAIMSLDKNDREVIILYYYQELTMKEISHIIGRSENTTIQRVNRARKKLKKILEAAYE